MKSRYNKISEIISKKGGIIRTAEAVRLGIYSGDLTGMKKEGIIEQISRGIYRVSNTEPDTHNDLAVVSLKIPRGVICLISALSFHDITTQIPHAVYIALPKGFKKHKIAYPPVQFFRLSKNSYEAGIENHKINGVNVKIYSPEKTVVDCFKFRNKIGIDVAIEALKSMKSKRRTNINQIIAYAKINRVEKIIKPYLESIL